MLDNYYYMFIFDIIKFLNSLMINKLCSSKKYCGWEK